MAKKGLGDLLREEAQKSLESEVNGTVERSQELAQKSPDTPNHAEPASAQTVDVTAQPVEASDQSDDAAAKAKRGSSTGSKSTGTKAAATKSATSKTSASDDETKPEVPDTSGLEATIAELRKDLEAARKTEKSLLDKISAIQADLDEQKSLAHKLQTEVKHSKKLESELEEAKKVILQLTETYAKPEPAAKQPEPVQANRAAAKREPAKPQSAQLARVPKPPAPEPANRDYRSHRIVLQERIPQHSMHQHYPSKTTSDADLGWFD